jgi:pectate lyase
MGDATTTGGDGGPETTATTTDAFNQAAGGTDKKVVHVSGTLSGTFTVGSNKTIVGASGATLKGHVQMDGSHNVILRNLTLIGNNCRDSPSDCSAGADTITVVNRAHHLWFDHLDISDGSDGNLDITHASDYTTVSWTKFSYSSKRAGGHQFSNLIGHNDNNGAEDTGHLKVTFHHVWWADNVDQRMPRVRFGEVHIFNSLYTATGNSYCVAAGVNANIRTENNVFIGTKSPIDSGFANSASIAESKGNLYQGTTGSTADINPPAFVPPYPYTLDATASVQALVTSRAGPR